MTVIGVQPFVLKDLVLKIDADNYEKHVSTVRFDPSSSTVEWQGGTPDASFTETTTPKWTCTLAYAQDWSTANSLARYLFDHAGETKTVVFQPKAGTGLPNWTADLIIAPGPIGGDVDTVQAGSVTMGVDGKPVPGTAA